ncbi:MAG TPA: ribokinase [Actinophytocola sp.]|uniref:ribokinase n=1 Tax=Actinophytocola sp. TaxID=1872138 RepID=UPI002DBAD199|nr:ribokinase [Actinophytocola sp.]HEU5473101.1 ribokinase [Actinophytocola sp.]
MTVERRPAAGETVLGSDTVTLPGGKGANTAVAAARLGGRVAFLGAVGPDAHGDLLLESLRAAGVDVTAVRRTDRPTGIACITVTPDGENAIVVSPGANHALRTADVDRVDLAGTRILVASLEVPVPVVEHAIAVAAAHGVRAMLNLSPVARLAPATLAALDPLVVNEHEAAALLGSVGANATEVRRLLDLGPVSAVVTLGARGAVVVSPAGQREIPAPRVDPVDTTGAGDAFTGALAVALAGGAELADAAELAVRVAAFSVTRAGAQPSYPSAAELS